MVTRLDRIAHNGGLSRADILCGVLDVKEYNTVEEAKLVAMRQGGITHILGYTNKSCKAGTLCAAVT